MFDEIKALGFDAVELGYGATQTQLDGIRKWTDSGAIKITSVHAFCPNIVVGASGPEVFSLCDPDDFKRGKKGISAAKRCAEFAASIGAKTVVTHAGRVPIFRHIRALAAIAAKGLLNTTKHEKQMLKIIAKRDKKSEKHLATLYESLEEVLPDYAAFGVTLALENLPTYDTIPNETEMADLLREFNDMPLRYWHDFGHGQIRQNYGFIHHRSIVSGFRNNIAGFHIHDVVFPDDDHQAPSATGTVDFKILKDFIASDIPLVLEPSRHIDATAIANGVAYLSQITR